MGGRARRAIVAIGCVLLVVGVTAALTRAVPVRIGTNETLATDGLGNSVGRVDVCQDAETIPAGTGAVRVSMAAAGGPGPALVLIATDGRTTVGRGRLAAGWSGRTATIPLRPATRAQLPARVCVRIDAAASVALRGEATVDPDAGPPATASGSELPGRLRLEYLAPERQTWLSEVGTIARRMGFGRAIGGPSVALLALVLMLGAASLGLWQLVRGER